MNTKWRYIIVIAICIVLNELLGSLATAFGWPVWLDVSGTATAALVLEPAAGLLVGLVNNFYIAIGKGDASTLIYYSVSAAVAVIVGVNMRRKGKSMAYRIGTTIVLVIVVSTVLSALTTIWRTGGVPDSVWEINYYNMALGLNIPSALACFFGVLVVKVYDTLVTALLVAIVYFALPRALKRPREEELAARRETE